MPSLNAWGERAWKLGITLPFQWTECEIKHLGHPTLTRG